MAKLCLSPEEGLVVVEEDIRKAVAAGGEYCTKHLQYLNNKGSYLRKLGRHAESLEVRQEVYEKALERKEEVSKERMVLYYSQYANALLDNGRVTEALSRYERCLPMSIEAYGEMHSTTFNTEGGICSGMGG
jgi:tetratricopeptide (TPR) repeat protein